MSEINSVVSSIDTGTSIKFIGESDSSGNNLRIEDGKLSGTIVGSVIKDYTGRVDDVTLELSNVPIDGVGGGSGGSNVEVVNIECDLQATTVTSCDKTFAELEAAANAGKPVIGFLHSSGLVKDSSPVLMTLFSPNPLWEVNTLIGEIYRFPLVSTGGSSTIDLEIYTLLWASTDELPAIGSKNFKVMIQGTN